MEKTLRLLGARQTTTEKKIREENTPFIELIDKHTAYTSLHRHVPSVYREGKRLKIGSEKKKLTHSRSAVVYLVRFRANIRLHSIAASVSAVPRKKSRNHPTVERWKRRKKINKLATRKSYGKMRFHQSLMMTAATKAASGTCRLLSARTKRGKKQNRFGGKPFDWYIGGKYSICGWVFTNSFSSRSLSSEWRLTMTTTTAAASTTAHKCRRWRATETPVK